MTAAAIVVEYYRMSETNGLVADGSPIAFMDSVGAREAARTLGVSADAVSEASLSAMSSEKRWSIVDLKGGRIKAWVFTSADLDGYIARARQGRATEMMDRLLSVAVRAPFAPTHIRAALLEMGI